MIMDGAGAGAYRTLRGADAGTASVKWLAAAAGTTVGKAVVKAVIAATPPVHVHLLMHLHMNKVMIRVS
ncbi:hypothetical protein OIB37_20590 [Streptomyces sp. NBC_00820]|uniref:hypothetical protein n=1 Tax=Streptomyces sp. NBC_00820 TaxID=2975842 RepID=UPI002ED592C4|nr:hypothetical protein OIB37_20590 [Streptomyces sp. NBC_00820]